MTEGTGYVQPEYALFFYWEGHEFIFDPFAQCTATTTTGHRCRNPVFYGQEFYWDHEVEGLVHLDGPRAIAHALTLLCRLHLAMRDEAVRTSREELVP